MDIFSKEYWINLVLHFLITFASFIMGAIVTMEILQVCK